MNRDIIRVYRPPWGDVIQVLISRHVDGKILIARKTDNGIEYIEANPAELYDPTIYLSYNDAQALVDELWQCGFRPTEGAGSAGALAATQKHLEDMRKLVFQMSGKEK